MSEAKTPPEPGRVPYYRRDQKDGITPPDLSKTCTYAEHIVHARGKRTQYTSVSLDAQKIAKFGPSLYELECEFVEKDQHGLIEHQRLMTELQRVAKQCEKEERARALQAIRYARSALEGLVDWKFDTSGVERKELITWTWRKIQPYFRKLE